MSAECYICFFLLKMEFQAEVDFEFATIQLRKDGIVEFTQKPVVIDIVEVKECHAAMDALQVNQPFLLLVIVPLGASSTKEAREYASQKNIRNRIKAQAIVVDSLATRIMANVYMKINRPQQPIKVFSDKEAAIDWLVKKK
ncbi:MAG: STAS/SEC14 domain-containing protein [Flavobacteriales bacterium]